MQARAVAGHPAERTASPSELACAVYRQAEAKREAGDAAGAVDDFLRVAAVAPVRSGGRDRAL